MRRVPLAPVESARSLPARSTRLTLLTCGDTCVTRRSCDAAWPPPPLGAACRGPPPWGRSAQPCGAQRPCSQLL